MRLACVCQDKARELGRQAASGACPHCEGRVEAVDMETKWRFCCLPISYVNKRKYFCTSCSRRLVLYDCY
ncbi:uncharacterized protein LOC112523459 [Cynara cardunculus var. scolymus]|uniref:Methionyl-tRNA synthetase n=1 Tax=Cynara cardunculus var. scolymus TaxID=59895 RepID=A0A118JY75_CYNCS|nr:uncharacterized protein LOC112523459 [Cynara cardunculus var. scolymus]KVH97572.1 hypothetical protein Ccrd_000333 [Cynara cardunculus var. scolymus]